MGEAMSIYQSFTEKKVKEGGEKAEEREEKGRNFKKFLINQ